MILFLKVLEGGYHGNTNTLVGVSPYKFLRKGGSGPPPHVHGNFSIISKIINEWNILIFFFSPVFDIPDSYRGKHRDEDKVKAGIVLIFLLLLFFLLI